MVITLAEQSETPRPEWLWTMMRTYRTGQAHAFLLSGRGIHDIDATINTIYDNIYHIFGNKSISNKPTQFDFDMVVRYDRFGGFRFLGPAEKKQKDRDLFKQLVDPGSTTEPSVSIPSSGVIRGGPMGAAPSKGDILERNAAPALALPLINRALMQADVRICLILDEFQSLSPRGEWDTIGDMFTNNILAYRSWGLDFENVGGMGAKFRKKKGGHMVIGICDDKSEVSAVISKGRNTSGWVPLNVGFPTALEREYFIRENVLTGDFLDKIDIDFGNDNANAAPAAWLAGATGGLSIRAIEDIRLIGERHMTLTREMVQKVINDTIAEQFAGQGGSDYLSVINPTRGLRDYGFPTYLVEYLEWFLRQFRAGKLRNANILEAGPPGTGKSILAYALAYELGYKCVHWSPALTQSKWVGDSEKQLQGVLDWIEANLPCMVFIDEIDVALTSRDGGSIDTSGVGSKMLSILMPWLEREEIKGKLLLVGATNRADNIDAAMRRRMQTVIPVLPPITAEDRRAVLFNVLVREQGIPAEAIEIPDEVVSDLATKWYTQANLSVLAEKAASIASRRDEDFASNVAHFLSRAAVTYRVDTTRTESLSYAAASQASDTDLLPPGFEFKKANESKIAPKESSDEDEEFPANTRFVR